MIWSQTGNGDFMESSRDRFPNIEQLMEPAEFIFLYLFLFLDCISANLDETIPVVPHVALLSIQATSPERRFTQKEIIAGEERPKYLLIKQHQEAAAAAAGKSISFEFDSIKVSFLSFFTISFQTFRLSYFSKIVSTTNNAIILSKEKSIGRIGYFPCKKNNFKIKCEQNEEMAFRCCCRLCVVIAL